MMEKPLAQLGTVNAWILAVLYTLQIYFDFSGYSDMAIGLGKMFGFDFMENFNYPNIPKNRNKSEVCTKPPTSTH